MSIERQNSHVTTRAKRGRMRPKDEITGMDGHNYQQRQNDHEDWQLRKLWHHAKNRGFNIRVENDQIRLVPGLQWNATPARSFPWNTEGIKAARAWIDDPTGTPQQPHQPNPDQPRTHTTTQTTTTSQFTANAGARSTSHTAGLVLLGLLILGGVYLFHHAHPDYSKPWWNGTEDESMCQVVNNGLTKCYTVPLTSNGTEITSIGWPNGGDQSTGNTTCNHLDAGTTTPASWYCDFSDSSGRDWETSKNL